MKNKQKQSTLGGFTLEQLQTLRQEVTQVPSKEELLVVLDKTIKQKEVQLTTSLNARFSIDWMNIDQPYRQLLHDNGIENLAQLREVENIRTLSGMTEGAYEQISWARDFFDMTPIEQMHPEKREDLMEVSKVIVKHANEVSKKTK